ncbi:MAG: 4-alpha-glucanotransferase [Prevotella sp.]|nr:4-alpha-glucanotransferase [Bacteroides sp.]MCM1366161.1 4-alpha-glucanotransferase [Prevotella sp.]MCM1436774.1 4-alpha-glucanotransferase [Prevotella sp.]
MKITFRIHYHTRWGESLYICGDIPELGLNDAHAAAQMQLAGMDIWQLEINVPDGSEINYQYIVKSEDAPWRFEWGDKHKITLGFGAGRLIVDDNWQDVPYDKPYYSSAFVDGMLGRECRDQQLRLKGNSINISVLAPMVEPDEVLAIAGESDALGNWLPSDALKMNDARFPLWEANIPAKDLREGLQYKFVILKKSTREVVVWENRDNRTIRGEIPQNGDIRILAGLRFNNPRNNWKGAGTAIPVFSIRTDDDFGVGDFYDIKKMVDWCVATGQKVLQILPINDTTKTGSWVDSYPYSANSSFALHPMYLRPEAVGTLPDPEKRREYEALRKELNALHTVDYERVNKAKSDYFHQVYDMAGKETANRADYKSFVSNNESWLIPYAAWCVLRDINHTPDNEQWGEFASFDKEKVERFVQDNKKETDYYIFLQYHLDKQLREVRDYAHQHRVVLKGDIPIGVGRQSVDAWQNRRLFNMDSQAGAPPDAFSALGQNWGFPTYNWDEMARDGFSWWANRFRKMAEYFDAYRIDHILGFFRIWQIPIEAVHGLLGYFNPALPFTADEMRYNFDFWIDHDRMTNPLILDWMLQDFFGEYADEAKDRFLEENGYGRFKLRSFVNTQLKVKEYFDSLEENEKNKRLREALYGLIDDVLFIEDPYRRGTYHPRISAQFSYQYRILNDYEKYCFDRLYNDFFYHRHNDFWYGKAMWKLPPLLDSTKMLTCAEDLGMIPDCVPEVMHRLQILSLEIQRMPKDPKLEFGDTWNYPYYSVCTTSTHDMGGIRAWWEEDRGLTQRFYNNVLHQGGDAPYYAEPWICDKIIELQLKSPSMLCILPLQDWLSTDASLRRENPEEEIINVPANPRHYWRYRMHLPVEKLMQAKEFNELLKEHIVSSAR